MSKIFLMKGVFPSWSIAERLRQAPSRAVLPQNSFISVLAFFLLGLTILGSCKNGNSSVMHVNAYCRYDQEEGRIKAEAIFREGDSLMTAKPVVFQSGVSFIGSGMETHELPGGSVRYELDRTIELPSELPLFFKSPTGEEKTVLLPLNPVKAFSFADATLSTFGGFTLKFDGKPLSEGEKLLLIFTDANHQHLQLDIPGPHPGQEINVAPGKITLSPGPAQVYLVRTNLHRFQDGPFNMNLQTEYYTRSREVEVVK